MTPKNSISNGTLMLRADKESPIAAIRLPEIQTGLNPNLLTRPPTKLTTITDSIKGKSFYRICPGS